MEFYYKLLFTEQSPYHGLSSVLHFSVYNPHKKQVREIWLPLFQVGKLRLLGTDSAKNLRARNYSSLDSKQFFMIQKLMLFYHKAIEK